ncbi:ABC transporter permease [Clostridium sp. 'White wine YQ']|uniref:ABC transporter permease n=1 Tax=Clostridium sp. 'White wine YQ' TaxID=3027474 RepID=UPI0023669618|nr:ABC transporter permease subunit [Clostridium sp. 'White wine YQ']MDD7792907.1 ABC transporter permease subunit [Clostridium sp. 'White wine YQ']
MIKKRKINIGALATLSPVTFWMIIFFLIPALSILVISFCVRGEVGDIQYKFTLDNYRKLFNPLYIKIFFNSLMIAVSSTALCLIFGYPFAYIIARAHKKLKPILVMLVILPFWTNSLVRTYAMIILLRSEGILNTILLKLHIINVPIEIMYTNVAVMIGMIYMMIPFMVLPLYSSIEKVDESYIEAARDLGASKTSTFINVILPLTRAGIASGSLLVFIPTLGLFFISDLMGGSKVVLMSNLIKNQFLTARNWPLGSAISVVLIVVMLIFMALSRRGSGESIRKEVL